MNKLTFSIPASPDNGDGLKMWAIRLDGGHKRRLAALEKKLGKSKSDVIRHLLDEAHAQLVEGDNGDASAAAKISAATKLKREKIQSQIVEIERSASEHVKASAKQITKLKAELEALDGV